MKKYYVDGKEITKKEFAEIVANNEKYLNEANTNFESLLKCKFVVAI